MRAIFNWLVGYFVFSAGIECFFVHAVIEASAMIEGFSTLGLLWVEQKPTNKNNYGGDDEKKNFDGTKYREEYIDDYIVNYTDIRLNWFDFFAGHIMQKWYQ